jgi:hypothetical protein
MDNHFWQSVSVGLNVAGLVVAGLGSYALPVVVLAGVVVASVGAGGQFYFGKRIELQKEAAERAEKQLREQVTEMNRRLQTAELAQQQEQIRRANLMERLREEYKASHDGVSAGIYAGTEPLPRQWVEHRLLALGENWSTC